MLFDNNGLVVTRDYALCIYTGLQCLPENIETARSRFKDMHDTEKIYICFMGDPLEPVTALKSRIGHNPNIFYRYPSPP